MLMAVNEFFPLPEGEEVEQQTVRYRTVGDATCTGAVESTATDYEAVIAETASRGSPSAAPPAATTASPKRRWRTARRRATSR